MSERADSRLKGGVAPLNGQSTSGHDMSDDDGEGEFFYSLGILIRFLYDCASISGQ